MIQSRKILYLYLEIQDQEQADWKDVYVLKSDVELFSCLYIVMQHRQGDMSTSFKHESRPYPPSLSDRGKLRKWKKSDLLSILMQKTCLQNKVPASFDVK